MERNILIILISSNLKEKGKKMQITVEQQVEIIRELVEDKKRRLNNPRTAVRLLGEIAAFATILKNEFLDAEKYRMWHVLVCNELPAEILLADKFDFPGEKSVETFLRGLFRRNSF